MRYWNTSFATATRKGATTDRHQLRDFSVSFSPSDGAVIAKNCEGPENGQLIARDDDPWLLLKPPHCLRRGWYRLDLHATLPDGCEPRVYFNFGYGFQERFACVLHQHGDGFSAIVRAYKPTLSLRLDPTDRRAEFQLQRFSMSPAGIGLLTYLRVKQILGAVQALLTNPANWREHVASLRRDYLSTRGFVPLPTSFDSRRRESAYQRWIRTKDYSPERCRERLKAEIRALAETPLISILMPVFDPEVDHLDKAIASVTRQIYPNWELCIADDGSTNPAIRKRLLRWVQRDRRIKIVFRGANGHISEATNSAFALATGEWIALLDHDDELPEQALAEVALAIARNPAAQLIYSDEDKIDDRGRRSDPHFKPDFSIDLLRSMNYLNHLTVYRARIIRSVGGWQRGFEGSQDYDLNLRIIERIPASAICHIPKILYHWRMSDSSTASSASEKSYAFRNGLRALDDHLARCSLPATADPLSRLPYFRVRYQVPRPQPLVSLIIPTRDAVDVLRTCVSSIAGRTTYSNYEILIVDNRSEKRETRQYLRELTRQHTSIRVIPYDNEFNYSALNNFAVRSARGSVIGLLNNDLEVISPEWLTEMVAHALRAEVGCVGAKLYYPNDTVQHAGVVLGIGGVAGHAHKHFPGNAQGYFARLQVQQNLSAVTAACLLVRKSVYLEVCGLEEEYLRVAFNDVDFCLRVRAAGYLNVFTPFAELYHHESLSRGPDNTLEKAERFSREVAYMRLRWGALLDADPYYSPHLTLQREDFSLA